MIDRMLYYFTTSAVKYTSENPQKRPIRSYIKAAFIFKENKNTYQIGLDDYQESYDSIIKKSVMRDCNHYYFETYNEALRGLFRYLQEQIKYSVKEINYWHKAQNDYIDKMKELLTVLDIKEKWGI